MWITIIIFGSFILLTGILDGPRDRGRDAEDRKPDAKAGKSRGRFRGFQTLEELSWEDRKRDRAAADRRCEARKKK